ncbi:MAG: hypothetical protein MUF87_19125 [Anaerolineae bacterium]|nr:hypothetical protein [Anaerolineae bacterium]
MRLLQAERGPTLQRKQEIPYSDFDEKQETPERQALQTYVNKLDEAVMEGYQGIVTLDFMNWDMKYDGYVKLLQQRWRLHQKDALDENRLKLLPANAGYAIESFATRFKVPDGEAGKLSWQSQVADGATRPDIVVFWEGKEFAWIDLTSYQSREHIFKKDSGKWKTMLYVQEITYPGFKVDDFVDLQAKSIPKPNTNLEKAMEEYNQRTAKFREQRDMEKQMIRDIANLVLETIPHTQKKDYKARKNMIRESLNKQYNKVLRPKDAASFLQFAGINTKTFGFETYKKRNTTSKVMATIKNKDKKRKIGKSLKMKAKLTKKSKK